MNTNLVRRSGRFWLILVHNPAGLFPHRNTACIEHQKLLCTNHFVGAFCLDVLNLTGDFPVAGLSRPFRLFTVGVLQFPGTKEVPF